MTDALNWRQIMMKLVSVFTTNCVWIKSSCVQLYALKMSYVAQEDTRYININ